MGAPLEPKPETFEQAFVKLNAEVTDAFNHGDIKTCAAFYSEDALLFLSDRPPVRGRAAIEAVLQDIAHGGAKLAPAELLEISSSGDLGVCAGTYVFEMPSVSGAAVEQHGKFVTVFMRQPDGSWRAVIDSLLGDTT